MIQPALPLIPGLKGKPASQKHAPEQGESEKVESSQKPDTSTAQADIEKVESISTPSAAVNGDNQVHAETTAAASAVTTQSDAHFEEASSEEKDITEQLAGQCAAHENYLCSLLLTSYSRLRFRNSPRAACDNE
jgi:hypothetical protein